ncbi:hypothetical protein BDP81DRAFT_457409 [Colletotrichum phormii]|uniref:HNH nuclease domain-containing protein n=1 Tax=Colletotrichum phormii TaxID=359342 RepID=A0AAJ0A177_9PEZI|nr:uncharacterized protein BDP81DRAFT_457409 [Colletotrichum phormii]KAK1654590.1 hypothetical protein BDP81DRAFT_457409 [Colletotrichum phormii]
MALMTDIKTIECLQRDGFRCACSHFIDLTSAEERLVVPAPGMTVSFTHLCYILPFALGQLASPAGREAVDNIWSALYWYFPELNGKIGPNSLDQYQNLITFDLTVHKAYNSHDLAFKPLPGQPNKYEIDNMSGWSLTPLRDNQDVMSLVSSDDDIPLPEPEFFMVHRRVAKVLKISGIRARIEAEIKASSLDPEELNPDGSTDVGSILRRKMLLDV